jgi:Predicted membrane protein
MEENCRWLLDPGHGDEWKKKYFSFSGRLGRAAHLKRAAVLSLIVALVCLCSMLFFAGAGAGAGFIIFMLLFVLPLVVSQLSMTVRRLHDLGHSGLWILGLFFYSIVCLAISWPKDISFIFSLPATFFSLYTMFWPGTNGENQYGLPQRGLRKLAGSGWVQFQQEFFSREGRISRRWFFPPMIMLISYTVSAVLLTMLGLYVLSIGIYLVRMPMFDWLNLLVLLIVHIILWICGLLACVGFCARRLNDMGWPNFLAIVPVIIFALIPSYWVVKIWAVNPMSVAALFDMEIGSILFWLAASVVCFLAFSLVPGQKGANRHGESPMTAELVPGESADFSESQI